METVVLALRVALSLAVVLGLLWVLQRRFSRGARTGARKLVRVVERQTIGPKASVVVVDADGQRFLLGVTDQAVNVLDTREAPAAEDAEPAHRAPQTASDSFARLLERATGRATGTDNGSADYRAVPAPEEFPTRRASGRRAAGPVMDTPEQDTDVIPIRHAGLYPIDGGRRSTRSGRRASRPGSPQQVPESPLAGSILSPSTWKQTAEALKQVRSR